METKELYRQFKTYASPAEIERLREEKGGVFGATTFRRTSEWNEIEQELGYDAAIQFGREQTTETTMDHNVVTNEGLAHVLNVVLGVTAKISTWYLTMSNTNTAATNAMTGAVPVYTEITGTDVTETIRQTWAPGSVTGTTTASIPNSTPERYTCNTTGFTAFGASLIGGGTSALGVNNAGTLYAYSLFGTSKVMASTDTIDVTYTFTATDAV